jgi:hypothetical protein
VVSRLKVINHGIEIVNQEEILVTVSKSPLNKILA